MLSWKLTLLNSVLALSMCSHKAHTGLLLVYKLTFIISTHKQVPTRYIMTREVNSAFLLTRSEL